MAACGAPTSPTAAHRGHNVGADSSDRCAPPSPTRVCNGVCNGLGHNLTHPGTTWHNLTPSEVPQARVRGTHRHNLTQRGTTWHNRALRLRLLSGVPLCCPSLAGKPRFRGHLGFDPVEYAMAVVTTWHGVALRGTTWHKPAPAQVGHIPTFPVGPTSGRPVGGFADAGGGRRGGRTGLVNPPPGAHSVRATRQIRLLEGGITHLRIVALTAHAMAGDRERCLDSGMDDYLAKPVRVVSLKQAIDEYVRENARASERASSRSENAGRLLSVLPAEPAHEIDDEADQEDQPQAAATIGRSAVVEAAAAEQEQEDDDDDE